MAANLSNRKRVFADVVSIDAWTGEFSEKTEVSFHADVVFGSARVGGEAESPVRFKLSVKRAEIVLVIPEFEPVSVNPRTVFRGTPEPEVQVTTLEERSTNANAKGGFGVKASESAMSAKVEIGASGETSITAKRKIETASSVHPMHVKQSKSAEGYYRWEIKSTNQKSLDGRPWDSSEPNARLVDQRAKGSASVPPAVSVEVRCRREDLVIDALEIKDEGLMDKLREQVGFKNRMAAAVSYIRDELLREGLYVGNIEDAFGQLTLGSAIAHES